MLRWASLGSGSRGNATIVEWADGALLLDCGFSMKETIARLARLQRDPSQLRAIVVTHEHSDHIQGVAVLARRFNIPVYMTPGTYHSRDLGKIPQLNLIQDQEVFSLDGLQVEPVAVPHDAREPVQYIFRYRQQRLGVLTDLGSVSPHVENRYQDCDALVLEANHDPMMLAGGAYPPSLKQRVGGPWGHLSNAQAAGFLERLDTARLRHLAIAHISQKNNTLALTREAIAPVAQAAHNLVYACQDEGFEWLSLEA